MPIGGGHFPRGAAVGTQSQAPCDLAIDQSNPGALSFEENGASEEPQSPPAREMLGNYSYKEDIQRTQNEWWPLKLCWIGALVSSLPSTTFS